MRTITLKSDDMHKGSLILVNAGKPVRREPDKDSLSPAGNGVVLERQAANTLKAALAAAGSGGGILPVSGFRTASEQQSIYSDSLRDNGEEFTRNYVALPGCSEHETGLAVDLAENKEHIDTLRPYFPYSGVCGRFRESAAEYGFIERYPMGREHITHIAHEPWHFRYVGYPHSRIISGRADTLEEYTDYIKRFRCGRESLRLSIRGRAFEIFFVPFGSADCIEVPDNVPCQLSGNNDDGFVVTLWGNA